MTNVYEQIAQLEQDLAVAMIRANSLIHHSEAYRDACNEIDALRDQLVDARNEQWQQDNPDADDEEYAA